MDGEWEPPMIPNPEYKVGKNCGCLTQHLFNTHFTFPVNPSCNYRENGNPGKSTTPTTKESGCILRSITLNTALIQISTSMKTLVSLVLIFGRWETRWSILNNFIALVMLCQCNICYRFSGEIWHHLWQLPDHRWFEGSRGHRNGDMGCDKGMLLVFFPSHISRVQ